MQTKAKPATRKTAAKGKPRATRKWSKPVMERSDAMDLEKGVFAQDDPKAIAESLKRSAEKSDRRKSDPFPSAMSMLNFFINRGGKNLSKERLRILEAAKKDLREIFGRKPADPE